ncbi:endonuclease/exonuclease/phosphatase family protein [Lutimonas sp.]|uniref:endonuclease/exonuclease/phosphatase family protein n=1 Tax=Lutimonas sp. TaxID=1872403 RepID=UPI003D9ACACC
MMISYHGYSQNLSVMTYNIRYATVNDGDNQWEKRKAFLSDQIAFYQPEVFGIQEGLEHQLLYLKESNQKYDFIGVGRDDGQRKGEYCAIFYNKEKVILDAQGTFWLSETPEKVSKGWDAAFERICTFALFTDAGSGSKFWVFNTHFDHIGEVAREKSATLIAQRIGEINKKEYPVFLLGDFNLNEKSKPIVYLSSVLSDSRSVSEESPFGPHGTFTGFKFHEPVQDRIDYIFTSKNSIRVKKYAVLTDSKDFKYPSDHFPVFIKAELSGIDK